MIYEWFMVICLYAYVASSLGKALPLWRRRRRINLSGTRAERDEATFAAYAATWSTLVIAFAAFAAIVITSPDNQFVDPRVARRRTRRRGATELVPRRHAFSAPKPPRGAPMRRGSGPGGRSRPAPLPVLPPHVRARRRMGRVPGRGDERAPSAPLPTCRHAVAVLLETRRVPGRRAAAEESNR